MLQDTVDFSFVRVEKEDAAKYWCQYRVLEPPGTSGKSDRVKLLLTSEGSGENGGPGLFPQGHVPLVSPLCTQITGTPHPAFPSALGGTARDWPPAGFYSIDHDSLGPAIQMDLPSGAYTHPDHGQPASPQVLGFYFALFTLC